MILNKIRFFLSEGSERTVVAKRNIVASFGLKIISILISLQIVPLTINYVNPTQYGIWLTLSSIIVWISFFDLGFAHGFRNRFAEARANNDNFMARCYVSTTYLALAVLFFSLFIILFIVNQYLDWGKILNVDSSMTHDLQIVFSILGFFFCMNTVANVLNTMLIADQRNAIASCIQTIGQLISFIAIIILTKYTEGNLINLVFFFFGIPCAVLLLASFFIFHTNRYKKYSPSLKYFRFSFVKNILGLGSQFFIIMVSMLVIYQFINIIISRIEGPEAVTQYNIAYKYFNVLNMGATIVLAPFWSAFTEAYIKKDFQWMKNVQRKLEGMWLISVLIIISMLLCSERIYFWWIGDSVQISFTLSFFVAIYVLLQILVGIYVTFLNGISKVRIQLIIYLAFSIIAIPVINWGCKEWGTVGALLIPICACAFQAFFARIQVSKLMNCQAKGIWNK